jgi:uncharacterized protein
LGDRRRGSGEPEGRGRRLAIANGWRVPPIAPATDPAIGRTHMAASLPARSSLLVITAVGALLVGLAAGPVLGAVTAPQRMVYVAPSVDGQPADHTISVAGSGKVTVVPDMATISLGVLIQRDKAKAAREAGAAAMTKVIAALRALGIDDKDMQTATVSLNPVYDYQSSKQRITGYQLQNTVTVTVRDLAKVSDVLDDSVIAGATTVNGIAFDVADRTATEAQARAAAMTDAKAKADTLSGAAGVSITGVGSISESVSTPIWYGPEMAAGAVAQDTSTPVMPGSTDVTITVQVSYLID